MLGPIGMAEVKFCIQEASGSLVFPPTDSVSYQADFSAPDDEFAGGCGGGGGGGTLKGNICCLNGVSASSRSSWLISNCSFRAFMASLVTGGDCCWPKWVAMEDTA